VKTLIVTRGQDSVVVEVIGRRGGRTVDHPNHRSRRGVENVIVRTTTRMSGILTIIQTLPAVTIQGEGMFVTIEQDEYSMMSGTDHGAETELFVIGRLNLVVRK
jgi:hypothetical protein